jgi:hypothetical protein
VAVGVAGVPVRVAVPGVVVGSLDVGVLVGLAFGVLVALSVLVLLTRIVVARLPMVMRAIVAMPAVIVLFHARILLQMA